MEDQVQSLAQQAESSPNDPWAWLALAHALIEGGAVFPGRHVLQRASGVAHEDVGAWTAIAETFARLKASDAIDAYRRVVRLLPGEGGGEAALSRLFLEEGEAEAAEMEARNGLRHAPNAPDLHAALARALIAQDRFELALVHAETSLSRGDADDLTLAAEVYERLRRHDRLLEALARLRVLRPDDPELMVREGLAALAADRADRAKAAFEVAYERGPFSVATALQFAAGLRRIGHLNEALVILSGAQQSAPGNGTIAMERALVFEQLGRNADALTEFGRALSASPPPPRCSFYFGRSLARAGRLEDAATHLLRAAAADPTDEAVRSVLGDVLRELDSQAPSVPTAHGLDVDIKVFSLPELIEFLAQQRATGVLELRTPDGLSRITLSSGGLASVEVHSAPTLFETLKQRVVTAEQLAALGLDEKTPAVALVARLSDSEIVERAALESALTSHAVRNLMRLLPIREGRATFVGDENPVVIDDAVLVSARAAMFDAMRRLDEKMVGRRGSSTTGYSTS